MKKIIIALFLSAIMLICGCGDNLGSMADTEPPSSNTPEATITAAPEVLPEIPAAAAPEVTATPEVAAAPEVSGKADLNPEITEFLLAQMQSNLEKNTFEGFTYESTIGDVLKKIGSDKLVFAKVSSNIKWLGYPCVVNCQFGGSTDGKPLLTGMDLIICPDAEESDKKIEKNILAKLKKGLGRYKKQSGRYVWERGGLYTSFEPYSDIYGLPYIMLQRIGSHGYPRTPSIFPYKIGADVHKVCAGLTPCLLPGGQGAQSNFLVWKDGDSSITVQFREDVNGVIRFSNAYYLVNFDYMEPIEGIGYFEWLADKLEVTMGKAKGRGYKLGGGSEQYLTAQDILNSKSKKFRFVEYWEGISLLVEYWEHPSVQLSYGENYLRGTVKK